MNPRIRSSVGVVINPGLVEFFKGNTRRSVMLKMNSEAARIICSLDGTRSIEAICAEYNMDQETEKQFTDLIDYLVDKCIVYDQDTRIENEERKIYSRVFSMLEDYSCNEDILQKAWSNIKNARVCIVGIGAVGSWIAANLVQYGVQNLVLIDNDVVDITNLHRQWGYVSEDVGKRKTVCLKKRLMDMDESVKIEEINTFIKEGKLEEINLGEVDLIVDCADKPTVDETAVWIGEYCMKRNIPHIIAGGYNLHVSLIGQTIIPHKTACVKCFEKQLREHNELELANMKKLATPGRKIGSIGSMCSLSASFASLEAIKVLSKLITPSNVNRRGEFNIYNMEIKYHEYNKIEECEWCGNNGKYREQNNLFG